MGLWVGKDRGGRLLHWGCGCWRWQAPPMRSGLLWAFGRRIRPLASSVGGNGGVIGFFDGKDRGRRLLHWGCGCWRWQAPPMRLGLLGPSAVGFGLRPYPLEETAGLSDSLTERTGAGEFCIGAALHRFFRGRFRFAEFVPLPSAGLSRGCCGCRSAMPCFCLRWACWNDFAAGLGKVPEACRRESCRTWADGGFPDGW